MDQVKDVATLSEMLPRGRGRDRHQDLCTMDRVIVGAPCVISSPWLGDDGSEDQNGGGELWVAGKKRGHRRPAGRRRRRACVDDHIRYEARSPDRMSLREIGRAHV